MILRGMNIDCAHFQMTTAMQPYVHKHFLRCCQVQYPSLYSTSSLTQGWSITTQTEQRSRYRTLAERQLQASVELVKGQFGDVDARVWVFSKVVSINNVIVNHSYTLS